MRRDEYTLLVAPGSMSESGHISAEETAGLPQIENKIVQLALESGKIV
jgi:hypothetical protein